MTRKLLILLCTLGTSGALAEEISIAPATMARIGTVDERFQSYNVEMVEVTGGQFLEAIRPEHVDALRSVRLAAADRSDQRPTTKARRGTGAGLCACQRDLGQRHLLCGFRHPAIGATGRIQRRSDPPAMARRDRFLASGRRGDRHLLRHQSGHPRSGGRLDTRAGVPPARLHPRSEAHRRRRIHERAERRRDRRCAGRLDAAAYGRDFKIFRSFVKRHSPDIMILGPGHGAAHGMPPRTCSLRPARGLDAFSYHHYGALSERCRGPHRAAARALRKMAGADRSDPGLLPRASRPFAPGKPIWLTETAEAACGGNRWAATFLDTFRYLDQLGRLAKAGVQVVMHNTLAASDYGLLDEKTLTPRPNYWGALIVAAADGNDCARVGVPIQAGFTSMPIANAASPAASACWSSTPTAIRHAHSGSPPVRSVTPWTRQACETQRYA